MRNALKGITAVESASFFISPSGEMDIRRSRSHVAGLDVWVARDAASVGGSVPAEQFDEAGLRALALRLRSLRATLDEASVSGTPTCRYEGQSNGVARWRVVTEWEGVPVEARFWAERGNRYGWGGGMASLSIDGKPAEEFFGVGELSLNVALPKRHDNYASDEEAAEATRQWREREAERERRYAEERARLGPPDPAKRRKRPYIFSPADGWDEEEGGDSLADLFDEED